MMNELHVWRAKRDRISQRDLAKAAGITADRYWRIENDYAEPTADEIADLVRVLDATPAELFPGLAEQQNAGAR